jgi:hypothetical protein
MSQIIDKKLFAAIGKLNDEQKKEVLLFVGNFLEGGAASDKWQDINFLAEMNSRYDYYQSGGKMISSVEADKRIKSLLEKNK